MPLSPGSRVGAYEVIAALGEGGMGQVYRARDARLSRDAAIKILPDAFVADPARVARFEREARTLAALNHPNIAQIYGLEAGALVMELVEGDDLSTLIARGPVPVAEALRLARQIAAALEAAHEQGIVHRDLKPANIRVRADGTVKVLDFGLAKGVEPASASGLSLSDSPTITSPVTELGVILGTAAYMSPEQARGKPVDRRADVWAFGVILYEMITGRRAFDGAEVSDVLAAVLKDPLPLESLPPEVPAPVRRLLKRCLERDRTERLDSMTAARLEIADAMSGSEPGATPTAGPAAPPRSRAARYAAAAGAALVAAAATGLVMWRAMQPAPPLPATFRLAPPGGGLLGTNINQPDLAISPDGRRLAYSEGMERSAFILRSFTDGSDVPLLNLGELPRSPFFSPDGVWLGYFSAASNGANGRLMKIPVAGGAPVEITRTGGNLRGASWADDGTVVFGNTVVSVGLQRVSADGGAAETITTPNRAADEVDHLWPFVLPGSRHALFTILRQAEGSAAVAWDLALLDLASRTWRTIRSGGSYPQYLPTGHLLFLNEAGLHAMRFDPDTGTASGDPVLLLSDVVYKPSSGGGDVSVSRTGTLAYVAGDGESLAGIASIDRRGQVGMTAAPARRYGELRLSPDGTRMAVSISDGGFLTPWMYDLARETLTPLSDANSFATSFAWSPDGREVFFLANIAQRLGIYRAPASGTSRPQLVVEQPVQGRFLPMSVHPREPALLVLRTPADGPNDLHMLSLSGVPKTTPFLASGNILSAEISPDGRWLAYVSADGTEPQLFLRPFPDVAADRIQLSTNGARAARWRADGRALFYVDPNDMSVWTVAIGADGSAAIGKPQIVKGWDTGNETPAFAVTPDGERVFRIRRRAGDASHAELRVTLNWFDELRAKLPK